MKEEKQKRKLRKISNKCVRCGRGTYKNNDYCFECMNKGYHKRYLKKRRKRKSRFQVCLLCGTSINVMPFVGFCKKCYRNQRFDRERSNK